MVDFNSKSTILGGFVVNLKARRVIFKGIRNCHNKLWSGLSRFLPSVQFRAGKPRQRNTHTHKKTLFLSVQTGFNSSVSYQKMFLPQIIVAWTQSLMWLFVGRLMKAVLRIILHHLERTICVTAQVCLKTEVHLTQFVAPFQILALRQQASVSALHCLVHLLWHKSTAFLYRSDNILFYPQLLFLLPLLFFNIKLQTNGKDSHEVRLQVISVRHDGHQVGGLVLALSLLGWTKQIMAQNPAWVHRSPRRRDKKNA